MTSKRENEYGQSVYRRIEQQHKKTNKMTWAPREDLDQPGHLPSLIRVLAVRMKKHGSLATH